MRYSGKLGVKHMHTTTNLECLIATSFILVHLEAWQSFFFSQNQYKNWFANVWLKKLKETHLIIKVRSHSFLFYKVPWTVRLISKITPTHLTISLSTRPGLHGLLDLEITDNFFEILYRPLVKFSCILRVPWRYSRVLCRIFIKIFSDPCQHPN